MQQQVHQSNANGALGAASCSSAAAGASKAPAAAPAAAAADSDTNGKCAVCWEEEANHVFIPVGHKDGVECGHIFCKGCANMVEEKLKNVRKRFWAFRADAKTKQYVQKLKLKIVFLHDFVHLPYMFLFEVHNIFIFRLCIKIKKTRGTCPTCSNDIDSILKVFLN